jgi:hypothetical protein
MADSYRHLSYPATGAGILMLAADDFLQRWPVSKRVDSSKADADDPMLIEPTQLAPA